MESQTKNESIGGASSSTNGGSNVSGRADVIRGASPGRHLEILEGVSGPQANSGLKTSGKTGGSGNQACSGSNGSQTTGTDSKTHESQKTKKIHGGNDARPSSKIYETFDNLYRPRNFTRFYTIKATGEANIAKANIFRVDKALKSFIGEFERLSEDLQNKSWTIEVKNEQQGEKLLTMSELLSEPIIVTQHESHNKSQGVTTCTMLKNYTEEEVTEGLSDYGVIGCRRIIRNPKSPNPEPTSTLILTFNTPNPPDNITIITGIKERVRPYIPLPRRCFNCQNYGHSGAKCRRIIPVCSRCGDDIINDHKEETCQRPINCTHCQEPHSVASRNCPRYQMEKEILFIKTKEHLTFKEARARINFNRNNRTPTYASITKNNSSMPPPSIPNNEQNMTRKEIRTPSNQPDKTSSIKRPLQRTISSSSKESQQDHNNNEKSSKYQRIELSDHSMNAIEPMDTNRNIPLTPDKLTERRNSATPNRDAREAEIRNSVRRKKGGGGKAKQNKSYLKT